MTKYSIDDVAVSDDATNLLPGAELITPAMISYKKPTKTEWFKIRFDVEPITVQCVILKDAEGLDTTFPIFGDKKFRDAIVAAVGTGVLKTLYHYKTSNGRQGIWPVTVVEENKYKNNWVTSARDACLAAQKDWVRISVERGAGYYKINHPAISSDKFKEINFDNLEYLQCVEYAFDGLIIDKENYKSHSPLNNFLMGKNVDY